MVTVRIFGGLGNQLFQYAFGRYLSLKSDTGLILDYYHQMIRPDFDGENLVKITDVFDLPVRLYVGKNRKDLIFKRDLHFLDRLISGVYAKIRRVVTEDNYGANPEMIEKCKRLYLIGYWQSEHYFAEIKDIIRGDFKFKIEQQVSRLDLYKEMAESNSVSFHIRGKDYLKNTFYARCGVKYYMDALDIISGAEKKIKCFIFTDDVKYVSRNFAELLKFAKVVDTRTDINPDVVDLLLMSRCKHNVICNSSFSWWGAWLNNNPSKIVIAPKKWVNDDWINDPHYSNVSRVPADWRAI